MTDYGWVPLLIDACQWLISGVGCFLLVAVFLLAVGLTIADHCRLQAGPTERPQYRCVHQYDQRANINL